MGQKIGNKVKKGMLWTFAERIGTKLVQFCLQLLLARILVPEDYGLCALLLAFINIATVFVNSGLGAALVQKKNADSLDFSSVLYVSLSISLFLYTILYISAPSIARFFEDDRICLLLRVISITLVIGSYNSVQMTVLLRKMNFRSIFIANLCGIIFSAIISLYLALSGYGVWAIVWQYIVNRIVVTFVLAILIRWIPIFSFSFTRVRSLFSFGWKLMATSLLSTIVTDIYTAAIGKVYTKAQLGTYDTGNKIPSTVSETFTSSLGSVLFPAFSQIQDNVDLLRGYVAKANKISSFIVFPLMFGVAAAATPIITILLTDKWIGAVPFMQIACLLYAFYPLHIANIQAISAIGRSDVSLKCEMQKKVVDIMLLVIMIQFSIYWVALGRALTSIISLWINMRPNQILLKYSFKRQIIDILPSFMISLFTSLVMYSLILLIVNDIILLALQILTGFVLYISLSYLFNRKAMLMVLQVLIKSNK